MSNFEKNRLFSLISSLFKSTEKDNLKYLGSNKNDSSKTTNKLNKIWKKDYMPLRHVVLWGWDDNHNPSLLILYGIHQFKGEKRGKYNTLEDDVKYTSYAVFKGREGHLPSLQSAKIIEAMYFNKDNKHKVNKLVNLKNKDQIKFSYPILQSHAQCVQEIEEQEIEFTEFKLAKNPEDVIELGEVFAQYSALIIDIMSHHNLYIRKKQLKELITMNPPKEIYIMLLEIGSTELVSGLFLELAKGMNPVLMQEAKKLVEAEIKWGELNYSKGVKRCIQIYLNSLKEDLKAERTRWIRKYLSQVDLHLIRMNGKDIQNGKILEGSAYRKYANSGLLQDYYWKYDQKIRKNVKLESEKRYELGPYTDGVRLKIIDFKNTLQEAEIYELADAIGKIAYYLDAPRLNYNLKGSGRNKTLRYFRGVIRRILNSYAQDNPNKFMEAMKHLLTSYNEQDCLSKFKNNFQFNMLLKQYLYYDFKEESRKDWSQNYNYIPGDPLMRLEGRYEFKKEIWDNNLEIVGDIAIKARIETVVKACYYILKDSPKNKEFIENIKYVQLINLALVDYEPLAEMFMTILTNKLQQLNTFDSELMICLIGSTDKKIQQYAMEFFTRTKGLFSSSDLADLLFLNNLQQWEELFEKSLFYLEGEQYLEFIREIINRGSKFLEQDCNLTDNIKEILSNSINKIEKVCKEDKLKLFSELITVLFNGPKLPYWMGTFIESVIFSFSYEELESLVSEISTDLLSKVLSARNKIILSVLECIKNKNLLEDSKIIEILDTGSSQMIKAMVSIIKRNREELKSRFRTLLILLESQVTVLNQETKKIFESIDPEKQKQLHAMFIDSPALSAYSFGLKKLDMIYGDLIPQEFIIQMLEHNSTEVKAYIAGKTNRILDNLGNGNEELFMYYLKTLLLLPNKVSKSKDKVYAVIPKFVQRYKNKLEEIENLLLDIGGSNIIIDSERALVALAKIRGEVI